MYPARFRYESPRSLDEALDLLRVYGNDAKVLAGGQSLIPLMKLRFGAPEVLVDVNNIPDLDYLEQDADGTLRVGALVRHRTLERAAALSSKFPTMAAVAPLIADPIVRTRGTLVGSVCHADPQGDWGSVMLALGGEIVAKSAEGERRIPVSDFMVGPFQNSLRAGELAVEARIPAPAGMVQGTYMKLERRVGDFATVGVALAADMSGGTVSRAGIALTGVGGSNIKATAAEDALQGSQLNEQSIERAAELAAQAAEPKSDHRGSAEYKRHMVYTFVKRGFASSYARAA